MMMPSMQNPMTYFRISRRSQRCDQDQWTYSNDFDDREDKLGLAIASDTEEIDDHNSGPEDDHPRCWRDIVCSLPEGQGDGGCCEF